MRKVVAVAWREVEERKHFLLISLVTGTLAVIVPLARGMSVGSESYETVRDLTALTIGGALGLSLAFMLGLTIVTTELVERRSGFYFSRPLSPAAIWWGKVLGAFVLSMLSVVLTLLPSTLTGGGIWRVEQGVPFQWNGALSWLGAAAILLFTILAVHALSTMVRSRSKWLGWDLVALTVVVSVLVWLFPRLASGGSYLIIKILWRALAVTTFGALA